MFTGFASENIPAIQVWDFFSAFASTSAYRNIALADDCAPIQFFKTGATTTSISLYLPTAPIEGKQIKLINARYGANNQIVNIYSSDTSSGFTTIAIYTLGQGQTLDLCYSKNFISFGASVGSYASGWIPLNQSPIGAANTNAVVLGGNTNQATSGSSSVIGGVSNLSSASNAAIVGGSSNTASNTGAATLGGNTNTASSINSIVVGGSNNNANTGSANAIVGGQQNNNSASTAGILGGFQNTADSTASAVIAGYRGTTRGIQGNTVLPASISPVASLAGASQFALLILGVQTTDATATVLRSNTSAATTTNQVILPNNSAYFFRGEVVAGVTGAGDSKGWTIEGVIKRGANAASTALVGTPTVTSSYADAGASAWTIAVTADTTNGGLTITVTGQAATTIRWVAQIRTTEMTY